MPTSIPFNVFTVCIVVLKYTRGFLWKVPFRFTCISAVIQLQRFMGACLYLSACPGDDNCTWSWVMTQARVSTRVRLELSCSLMAARAVGLCERSMESARGCAINLECFHTHWFGSKAILRNFDPLWVSRFRISSLLHPLVTGVLILVFKSCWPCYSHGTYSVNTVLCGRYRRAGRGLFSCWKWSTWLWRGSCGDGKLPNTGATSGGHRKVSESGTLGRLLKATLSNFLGAGECFVKVSRAP